jgi:alanine racemase
MFPEEGLDFIRWVSEQPNLTLDGVFTHLACADEPEKKTTNDQLARFDLLLEQLEQGKLRPRWVHAANSAGTLYFPKARYDLVRPGIAIYGQNPSPQAPLPVGFQPAMSFKSRLSSIKTLPPKHGVSYGHRYMTSKAERVGVISAGYADGYRRSDHAFALVRGKRVRGTGIVCMDQLVVSLDDVPEAKIGDEVILFGQQGGEVITVDELAEAWGTITYEVVCAASARPFRLYIDRAEDNRGA